MAAVFTAYSRFKAQDQLSAKVRAMGKNVYVFAHRSQAAIARVDMQMRKLTRAATNTLGVVGKLGLGFSALMIVTNIAKANVELDESLQSLQAITGVTGKAFVQFEKQIDAVSKRQKVFAGDTAKAFELVGSAKPELLANAEALGKTTEAALILAKAGKMEVTDSVKSLTVSMNQFGAGADKATEFVNILATAQQKGSGTIQYLSEAMVNAGGTSKAFGNSFADTVAILEGFAKAGVPASEAGTMLAGILSKLSKNQNKDFNPQFTKATDIIDNLAKANLSYTDLLKMTDVRGAKWLTTIINQNSIVQELSGNLNELGNAQAQSDLQGQSLRNLWKEIVNTFRNATTATDSQNESMLKLKKAMVFVSDNMEKILGVAVKLIAAFISYKTIILASKAALVVFNVVTGISAALMGKSAFLVHGNTVAYAAYRVAVLAGTAAMKIATIATTAWGIAMKIAMGPVGWIILAVTLLIALITVIIKKWDQWGAAVSLFLGPLGLIISLVQSFRRNWQLITAAFKEGGIKKGILAIGKTILDAILMPVQQLLELLSKIPGLKIAGTGAERIQELRNRMFEPERAMAGVELESPREVDAKERRNFVEKVERQKAELNITMPKGLDGNIEAPGLFPIMLTSTTG